MAGEEGRDVPARRPTRDQVRERRIEQEIVVDAYDPDEQATDWSWGARSRWCW
jgi:endonuclease I